MTDTAKDEELMPPPSSSHKQEITIQCENLNTTINNNRKLFLEYFIFTFTLYTSLNYLF